MSYTLVNVEDRNRENPTTFHIGSRAKRESLMVGDLAKCIFQGTADEGSERMWLIILDPISRGRYHGKLDNVPSMLSGISFEDEIEFGPEHISDMDPNPQPGMAPGLRGD